MGAARLPKILVLAVDNSLFEQDRPWESRLDNGYPKSASAGRTTDTRPLLAVMPREMPCAEYLRCSSRKAESGHGPARVVGVLAWPRHTN